MPELDPQIVLAKMKKAAYDDADRKFKFREHLNSGLFREMPRKADTPRAPTAIERLNEQNLQELRDYFREYNASNRSSNVDDTNRTMSVLDESEVNEMFAFYAQESKVAGSVWGDIFRNSYLATVRNAPPSITPGKNEDFHPSLKGEELRNSFLYANLIPPPNPVRKHFMNHDHLSKKSLSVLKQCS